MFDLALTLPPDGRPLRLSPTDVSQFIRLEQCERYLRLRLYASMEGSGFMREYGVAPQEIPPLRTRSGREFEERIEEAIAAAGAGDFGLQAGIFTNDLRVIDRAFDELETGGVMVNDVPTFRVDHMPYGGVKESGFGREGPRYAIEEMTELKLMTFNRRPA